MLRIPLQLAAKFDRDVREMADRRDAMPDVHGEIWVFATANTFQEVIVLSAGIRVEMNFTVSDC